MRNAGRPRSRAAAPKSTRSSDVGPANWLALDSYRAFAEGVHPSMLDHIASNEALARAFGDDETAWRCRDIMVSALAAAGRLGDSLAVAEDLMEHYRSTGQAASRLQILGQSITARFARGEFERALEELTDGLVGLSRLPRLEPFDRERVPDRRERRELRRTLRDGREPAAPRRRVGEPRRAAVPVADDRRHRRAQRTAVRRPTGNDRSTR